MKLDAVEVLRLYHDKLQAHPLFKKFIDGTPFANDACALAWETVHELQEKQWKDSPENAFLAKTITGFNRHGGEKEALVTACEMVLMFHSSGPWDDNKRKLWKAHLLVLLGSDANDEATTKRLCDAIRAALAIVKE